MKLTKNEYKLLIRGLETYIDEYTYPKSLYPIQKDIIDCEKLLKKIKKEIE